jgi:hypothetical protein
VVVEPVASLLAALAALVVAVLVVMRQRGQPLEQ